MSGSESSVAAQVCTAYETEAVLCSERNHPDMA
jgi:hypothetical protein